MAESPADDAPTAPASMFRLDELEPHQQLGAAIQQCGNVCAYTARGDSDSRVAVALIQLGVKIAQADSMAAAIEALSGSPPVL